MEDDNLEYFGMRLIISEEVQYVGEGEDPAKDPYIMALKRVVSEKNRGDDV